MSHSSRRRSHAHPAPYSVRVELGVDALVVAVHDFSWASVAAVRDVVAPLLPQRHLAIRVDLHEMGSDASTSLWLAALVRLARLARQYDCSVTAVAPPPSLERVLRRALLPVEPREQLPAS